MPVPVPVALAGAAALLAALWLAVEIRRARRSRVRATAPIAEPREAVFVDEPEPPRFTPPPPLASVYPVHKLVEQLGNPLMANPPPLSFQWQPEAQQLGAETLEPEPQPEPVAPSAPSAPSVPEPVQQSAADVAPAAEIDVATLTAQVAALTDTIARLTERMDTPPPAPTAPVPSAEFVSPPESFSPLAAPTPPEPPTRAQRMSVEFPPHPAPMPIEPPARVDEDLFAWPSDDDLEQFARRQLPREDA